MKKIANVVALMSMFSFAACAEIIDQLYTPEDYCFECPEVPVCPEIPECLSCPEVPECPTCPDCPTLPPVVTPTPEPTPEPDKPLKIESYSNGNVYKPISETTGQVVVILADRHNVHNNGTRDNRFQSCKLGGKSLTCIDDQAWTQNPYSCLANGNRQHWRGSFKCSELANKTLECEGTQYDLVVMGNSNVCARED